MGVDFFPASFQFLQSQQSRRLGRARIINFPHHALQIHRRQLALEATGQRDIVMQAAVREFAICSDRQPPNT